MSRAQQDNHATFCTRPEWMQSVHTSARFT